MTEKHSLMCPFEHIENPDLEAKEIAETAELTVQLLGKRYPPPDKILRGVHPKSHACVKAWFEINSDIKQNLQAGLFSTPRKKFDALIRFSNAAPRLEPDVSAIGEHGSRGVAIKVFKEQRLALVESLKCFKTDKLICVGFICALSAKL